MTTQDKALVALAEALGSSCRCEILLHRELFPDEICLTCVALETHAQAIQEAKERLKQ